MNILFGSSRASHDVCCLAHHKDELDQNEGDLKTLVVGRHDHDPRLSLLLHGNKQEDGD